jgi:hypothetical protein
MLVVARRITPPPPADDGTIRDNTDRDRFAENGGLVAPAAQHYPGPTREERTWPKSDMEWHW